MVPTNLIIIPSAGHSDDSGKFTRGYVVDTTSEVDVVDSYSRTLMETLEEYGVNFDVMSTRTAPGTMQSRRHLEISKNSLAIELSVGYFETNIKRNRSDVFYYNDESKKLADMLADTLGDWGRNSSFGHSRGSPKKLKTPILSVEGAMAVKVAPFAINGPHYEDYLPTAASLGHSLGMALVEFMTSVNSGCGYQPFCVKHYKA